VEQRGSKIRDRVRARDKLVKGETAVDSDTALVSPRPLRANKKRRKARSEAAIARSIRAAGRAHGRHYARAEKQMKELGYVTKSGLIWHEGAWRVPGLVKNTSGEWSLKRGSRVVKRFRTASDARKAFKDAVWSEMVFLHGRDSLTLTSPDGTVDRRFHAIDGTVEHGGARVDADWFCGRLRSRRRR